MSAELASPENGPSGPVDLSGQDLRGQDFTGADLAGANLSGCNLEGAQLMQARLSGANLSRANLSGAELSVADLSDAILEETKAQNAGFGMATLRGAKLFGAHLEGATFSKADLSGADLRCARLQGARIREANLTGCDFTSADLSGAELALSSVEEATFRNAEVRDAQLRNLTHFDRADWIGVDINSINFTGAYRLRRFVVDQNYLKEFRESSPTAKWLYHLWWVTSDCGRSIIRWGCWNVVLTILFGWIYTQVGIDFGDNPTWLSPFYYSVVTFTTLGYGDITPVTVAGQMVAIAEVVCGYLMLGGLLSILSNIIARRGE